MLADMKEQLKLSKFLRISLHFLLYIMAKGTCFVSFYSVYWLITAMGEA